MSANRRQSLRATRSTKQAYPFTKRKILRVIIFSLQLLQLTSAAMGDTPWGVAVKVLFDDGKIITDPSTWTEGPIDANWEDWDENDCTIFYCSISHEFLIEPVITEYGNTYEKEDLENWLVKSYTDPLTNKEIKKENNKRNDFVYQLTRQFGQLVATILKSIPEYKPNSQAERVELTDMQLMANEYVHSLIAKENPFAKRFVIPYLHKLRVVLSEKPIQYVFCGNDTKWCMTSKDKEFEKYIKKQIINTTIKYDGTVVAIRGINVDKGLAAGWMTQIEGESIIIKKGDFHKFNWESFNDPKRERRYLKKEVARRRSEFRKYPKEYYPGKEPKPEKKPEEYDDTPPVGAVALEDIKPVGSGALFNTRRRLCLGTLQLVLRDLAREN